MFQAFGVHGPELTPFASMLLDIALVSAAFAFLLSAPRANRMTAAMLMTMVLAITALRVVMQPLPNVQPVTVAALLVGAHLGAKRGVAFAILVTLLSNLLISHGWWTLFQAIGWSVVAVMGANVRLIEDGRLHMQRFACWLSSLLRCSASSQRFHWSPQKWHLVNSWSCSAKVCRSTPSMPLETLPLLYGLEPCSTTSSAA